MISLDAVPSLNDPADVADEYASERGLVARRSLYSDLQGEDVKEVLVRAVLGRKPAGILEVGPGTGELAERLIKGGVASYTAIDISARMVELTLQRGVAAEVGDVQALPFDDGQFDCVVAAWMLYHVPDREAARVYVNASPTRAHLADRLPHLRRPLRVGVRTCVFTATK